MKRGLLKVAGAINTLNGEVCAHIEMIDEHRGYIQVTHGSEISTGALEAGNGYGTHSDFAIITGYSWGIVINF